MNLLYTLSVQSRWIALSSVLFSLGCASKTVIWPAFEPEPTPGLAEPTGTAQPMQPGAAHVKPDHPQKYIVVPGDTLWNIAARFLNAPWVWPAIWDANSQIENPHLIYPGDAISLVYIDGQPRFVVDRDSQGGTAPDPTAGRIIGQTSRGSPIVKLSPQIRTEALNQVQAIPTIPADAIEQFTANPRVLAKEQLDAAPYVVGSFDGRLISATGNQIYARGINGSGGNLYSIFRPGKVLLDPQSKDVLGHEATYISNAKVLEYGDPSTLLITKSQQETLSGDVLLPFSRGKTHHDYVPNVPDLERDGSIISLFDAFNRAAQHQIIVINLGHRDGMARGDILGIAKHGGAIRDTVKEPLFNSTIELPDTRIGITMIFRVFDRVSYGLIMASTHEIKVGDIITTP